MEACVLVVYMAVNTIPWNKLFLPYYCNISSTCLIVIFSTHILWRNITDILITGSGFLNPCLWEHAFLPFNFSQHKIFLDSWSLLQPEIGTFYVN